MTEAVEVALITGGLSLLGVIIATGIGYIKITYELRQSQAVTDTKLMDLTREVREHNEFARRVPVMEEQIRFINHRIDDLERGNAK